MLKLWRVTESHEDIFLQRYDWLVGWASRLTGNDPEKAEDLVHDAYIQFTLARPVLDRIHNLEAYLYALLRNLYLSDLRRNTRSPIRPAYTINYDSAEIGLRAVDPRVQLNLRDELRYICHYACARKETSKAGSVLILRFFHGYYPSEVAQVMNAPRRAVDDWLRIARREFATYQSEPWRLKPLPEKSAPGSRQEAAESLPGFLAELRRMIYSSRQGDCMSRDQLKTLYQSPGSLPLDCAALAHVVSCADCLEEVNRLLSISSLSDRFPPDMLGIDQDSKARNSSQKAAPGLSKAASAQRYQRLAMGVFEHHPEELHLSVNGYAVGSQKVSQGRNEQTISIPTGEKIGFVEVFSEQGIRLLFLMVEPPPDGEAEQASRVALSEGRSLALTVRFHDAWPRLQVAYCAPQLNVGQFSPQARREEGTPAPERVKRQAAGAAGSEGAYWRKGFLRMLFGWVRPATVTALVALALTAAVLFLRTAPPKMTVPDLLRRSGDSETALAMNANLVLHRLLDLEERRPNENVVISRHRIEIWSAGEKGAKARRVYDLYHRLTVGEWIAKDGTRTTYRQPDSLAFGAREVPTELPGTNEKLWQMEPSAETFSRLVPDVAAAWLEEQPGTYTIHYRSPEPARDGLIEASLRLNKSDFRPVEQVMLVKRGDSIREYRLIEREFRSAPADSVEPKVFEPDPGLLVTRSDPETSSMRKGGESGGPVSARGGVLDPDALAELEVDALYQFHRSGACLHDRTEVVRTAGEGLRVRAVVETESRKREMLQNFKPLVSTPGVDVEILTVDEALKQQVKLPAKPLVVRRVEIARGQIPAYEDLRNYFTGTARPPGGQATDDTGEQIRQFSSRVLDRSRRALLHAWALRNLVGALQPDEVARLSADASSRWHFMVKAHAHEIREESGANYQELAPIFFASQTSEAGSDDAGAADLGAAAEELFQALLFNDKVIRHMLTVSTDGAAVETRKLRDSLKKTERLTTEIIQ
jgi:RNA polymerase sigma factor (sigma-70 family)